MQKCKWDEVDCNTTSFFGDIGLGPPAESHAKWENKLEADFQIYGKNLLISQRKLDNDTARLLTSENGQSASQNTHKNEYV